MKKNLMYLFLAAVMITLFSVSAFAAPAPTMAELMKEMQSLRQMIEKQNARIAELETKLAGQEDKVTEHSEIIRRGELQDVSASMKHELERLKSIGGLEIGASATFIGQGTPNANNTGTGEDSRFDASWTMEIEIAKQFDDWGFAYLLMEPGQGNGLDDDLSLFSITNFDAANTGANPTVTEVWYEQYLFDGQLTLTGGKLYFPNYIDTNEYANDENRQFISNMFRNAETVEYPTGGWCLGARMYIAPEQLPFLDLEAVWGEADGNYEQVFDHAFTAVQLNFKPAKAFGYDEEKWNGNYRVYYWYNGNDHTKLEDPEMTKLRNYGLGISWDQMLGEVYGLFGRFGWQDPKTQTLEFHWSVGGQMTGKYWNREADVLGIGIGQVIPGKPYGDTGNPNNNETHLEAYYSFRINEALAISPDLQLIWRPNGVGNDDQGDSDTMFIYGARGLVEF